MEFNCDNFNTCLGEQRYIKTACHMSVCVCVFVCSTQGVCVCLCVPHRVCVLCQRCMCSSVQFGNRKQLCFVSAIRERERERERGLIRPVMHTPGCLPLLWE